MNLRQKKKELKRRISQLEKIVNLDDYKKKLTKLSNEIPYRYSDVYEMPHMIGMPRLFSYNEMIMIAELNDELSSKEGMESKEKELFISQLDLSLINRRNKDKSIQIYAFL